MSGVPCYITAMPVISSERLREAESTHGAVLHAHASEWPSRRLGDAEDTSPHNVDCADREPRGSPGQMTAGSNPQPLTPVAQLQDVLLELRPNDESHVCSECVIVSRLRPVDSQFLTNSHLPSLVFSPQSVTRVARLLRRFDPMKHIMCPAQK